MDHFYVIKWNNVSGKKWIKKVESISTNSSLSKSAKYKKTIRIV